MKQFKAGSATEKHIETMKGYLLVMLSVLKVNALDQWCLRKLLGIK